MSCFSILLPKCEVLNILCYNTLWNTVCYKLFVSRGDQILKSKAYDLGDKTPNSKFQILNSES